MDLCWMFEEDFVRKMWVSLAAPYLSISFVPSWFPGVSLPQLQVSDDVGSRGFYEARCSQMERLWYSFQSAQTALSPLSQVEVPRVKWGFEVQASTINLQKMPKKTSWFLTLARLPKKRTPRRRYFLGWKELGRFYLAAPKPSNAGAFVCQAAALSRPFWRLHSKPRPLGQWRHPVGGEFVGILRLSKCGEQKTSHFVLKEALIKALTLKESMEFFKWNPPLPSLWCFPVSSVSSLRLPAGLLERSAPWKPQPREDPKLF